MKLQTQAFIYQLTGFAIIFLAARFAIDAYTGLQGYWVPITAFFVGTILAPQFKAVKTKDGDRLLMTWIFMKGYKVLK